MDVWRVGGTEMASHFMYAVSCNGEGRYHRVPILLPVQLMLLVVFCPQGADEWHHYSFGQWYEVCRHFKLWNEWWIQYLVEHVCLWLWSDCYASVASTLTLLPFSLLLSPSLPPPPFSHLYVGYSHATLVTRHQVIRIKNGLSTPTVPSLVWCQAYALALLMAEWLLVAM